MEHNAGIIGSFFMGRDIAVLLKMVEQCNLCIVIASGFGEDVTSNHLDKSSVWKSLVLYM